MFVTSAKLILAGLTANLLKVSCETDDGVPFYYFEVRHSQTPTGEPTCFTFHNQIDAEQVFWKVPGNAKAFDNSAI